MLHWSNLDSSSPVFGEQKRLRYSLQKTPPWLTLSNNKISTLWLFLKYIISWEIGALKQYPLITKEVWIVSEAILKTHASCWPGSPETSKDARIFDTFEFLRNLERRTSFSETSKDARVFQKPRKTHEFFRNLKRRTSFSETLKNARDFDTLLESHYKRRGQTFLSLIEKKSLIRLSPFWIL